jgi:hypothetical protein
LSSSRRRLLIWLTGLTSTNKLNRDWGLFSVFGEIGERFWQAGIRKGKNGTKNVSNIAIEAPQWRCLILKFVDDFVELNFYGSM